MCLDLPIIETSSFDLLIGTDILGGCLQGCQLDIDKKILRYLVGKDNVQMSLKGRPTSVHLFVGFTKKLEKNEI